MQMRLAESAMERPKTLTSILFLRETAVLVRIGQETIGFLQTGQALDHRPSQMEFEAVAHRIAEPGADIDRKDLRAAYFSIPVISARKMEALTGLLCQFAEYLALRGNQIALQQAHAEVPAITAAKEYIDQNFREKLSLDQVAHAVHQSRFCFCKLFKQVTGLNFTNYVSCLRIEGQRSIVEPELSRGRGRPRSRFQSMTHFRVFKRIVRESPREYRYHLPDPGEDYRLARGQLHPGRNSSFQWLW